MKREGATSSSARRTPTGGRKTTHHISTWDIDERCLQIGVDVLYGAARRALESGAADAGEAGPHP